MKIFKLFLLILSVASLAFANLPHRRVPNSRCSSSNMRNFMFLGAVWQYNMHTGGAVLIKSNVALTAAHLLSYPADAYQVRFGSDCKDEGGQVYKVEDYFKHENYKPNERMDNKVNKDNDIALLHLKNNVNLYGITKIPIATSQDFGLGTEAWVAGWGRGVKNFKMSKVSVSNFETCKRNYNWIYLTDNMFCAIASSSGADSCWG